MLALGFGADFAGYDFETLKAEFLTYYADNVAVKTDFFDGVAPALDALIARNIPWGVVTNKPGFLTDPLLTHYRQFDKSLIAVSGDTLKVAKPNPEPLLHGVKALGIEAEQCLYVGDAERDIQAGKRAGMKTAVAMFGYIEDKTEVADWQADYHFDSLEQLLELV